ncbi:sigma-54-dependent Fis family transcriptional regulator [Variovorax sp. JS1663]|uniref:sigma-54-dependent Fis family transcriptional regulator n=1 Tax=Variovorax sp. JS1663 TaxID=1851577 RepID=UPI000B34789D|nr:sigma-54-dependent Fis family transcriptional regulator [Variovorax sp. JS1663]OUM02183.1 sigma-54-dependent Fis family transcriptional regulator [Variovorax sp. JS1663]
MELRQREHIDAVVELTTRSVPPQALLQQHDAVIRSSWQRCVHEHGLDPTRMQEARILPWGELREHQERLEDFTQIARHGLTALYQQVAGTGYVVLLTDAQGVTVDYLGDPNSGVSLRRAGLYLGAEWTETHAGTCAVGTALATGEALTVHQADHFDATHIPLTCTAAPVFDSSGRLNAILDISALVSPGPKASQQLALQLVKIYAHHIENAQFARAHRDDWILKLNAAPAFVDVNPDYLIALDARGRIVGHNHRARQMLEAELGLPAADPQGESPLLGRTFESLFDARFDALGQYLYARPSEQRVVTLARSGDALFLGAVPPIERIASASRSEAPAAAIPAPLAALSGGDAALQRQLQRAARLVDSPINLLIHGETGSGKEYFAKALHAASARSRRPFIAVNCAAIPETLIESELFGHLPGSFSGAGSKAKRGLIQESDGGTLFLDEIGDMPRELQSRLLRVLAEREVLAIGASRAVPVDIRVISATHHPLERLVREGRFREDLYYRLNGALFALPPLRERGDLDWLMRKLLGESVALSPAARERLHAHRWPGNLRELRNVLEYARAVCEGGRIEAHDLPDGFGGEGAQPAAPPLQHVHPNDPHHLPPEGMLLMQYLRAASWNLSAVARQLGISRMTLYRRMARLGIQSPNRRDVGEG